MQINRPGHSHGAVWKYRSVCATALVSLYYAHQLRHSAKCDTGQVCVIQVYVDASLSGNFPTNYNEKETGKSLHPCNYYTEKEFAKKCNSLDIPNDSFCLLHIYIHSVSKNYPEMESEK